MGKNQKGGDEMPHMGHVESVKKIVEKNQEAIFSISYEEWECKSEMRRTIYGDHKFIWVSGDITDIKWKTTKGKIEKVILDKRGWWWSKIIIDNKEIMFSMDRGTYILNRKHKRKHVFIKHIIQEIKILAPNGENIVIYKNSHDIGGTLCC